MEFILRNIMDLRLQLEEVRRRLDDRTQRVQVIELGESQPMADVLPAGEVEERGAVVYRPGMTMADLEKEAIAVRFADVECGEDGHPKARSLAFRAPAIGR